MAEQGVPVVDAPVWLFVGGSEVWVSGTFGERSGKYYKVRDEKGKVHDVPGTNPS